MAGGQEVRLEAVVSGSHQGARAQVFVAAVDKGDLRYAAQGTPPLGVATGVELAVIGLVRLACGGRRTRRSGRSTRPGPRKSRRPSAMRNSADFKRRPKLDGRGSRGFVFQHHGFGKDGGAPEVAVAIDAAAGVWAGHLIPIVQPHVTRAGGEI